MIDFIVESGKISEPVREELLGLYRTKNVYGITPALRAKLAKRQQQPIARGGKRTYKNKRKTRSTRRNRRRNTRSGQSRRMRGGDFGTEARSAIRAKGYASETEFAQQQLINKLGQTTTLVGDDGIEYTYKVVRFVGSYWLSATKEGLPEFKLIRMLHNISPRNVGQ